MTKKPKRKITPLERALLRYKSARKSEGHFYVAACLDAADALARAAVRHLKLK